MLVKFWLLTLTEHLMCRSTRLGLDLISMLELLPGSFLQSVPNIF